MKRVPPWLHGPRRQDFLGVQDHYDRMLRAEGFNDIERGQDLNKLDATTHPSPGEHSRHPQPSLREAPEGMEFWRAVGAGAHDLPSNYPRRAFILRVAATGNLSAAARRHHLTRAVARDAFAAFLARIGLGQSRMARSIRGPDLRARHDGG